jgi:hypothetical protein
MARKLSNLFRWSTDHTDKPEDQPLSIKPDKKVVAIISLLVLCLAAAVITIAINAGRWSAKAPLAKGNPSSAEGRYQVAFSDVTVAGDLVIRPLPDVADNGSLVYQVLTPQGAPVGTFDYIPWQEKNPLFRELPGGDLILGSHSLYRRSDQKIHNLGEGAGLGFVSDYSVNGSRLALEGKSSQEGDTLIYVYVGDLVRGAWTRVDSFRYPDYLAEKQVYLCWVGGKLYYDCWQGNSPVVKVYDLAANQSSVFKDNAMDPLASPDGRYLALFAQDSPSGKTGAGMGLELIDLESGRVTGLDGSSRVFWSPGYVTVWDGLRLQLHVYDLNSGAKVRDVPADSPVADLVIDNGVLRGASYHFENRQITREQFITEIGDKRPDVGE